MQTLKSTAIKGGMMGGAKMMKPMMKSIQKRGMMNKAKMISKQITRMPKRQSTSTGFMVKRPAIGQQVMKGTKGLIKNIAMKKPINQGMVRKSLSTNQII